MMLNAYGYLRTLAGILRGVFSPEKKHGFAKAFVVVEVHYTQDQTFLKNTAYPSSMKEASGVLMDCI